MTTRNYLAALAAIALAASFGACSEEDEWTGSTPDDISGTVDVTATTASEVLDFSVGFDEADKQTYAVGDETAPTDASDSHYGDYIENFASTSTLTITYDGTTAAVDRSIEGVDVSIDGADVTISSTTAGVTYVLTGSSTDGSFRMAKSSDNKKFGLTLSGLSLAKSGAPAINIQPSKRCYLYVEGTSTLSDSGSYVSSDEDRKACLFTEGKLLISGTGTLAVSSQTKHAIASDDYIWIHNGADLTLTSDAKDGLHANDSIIVAGGYVGITAADDGIACDADIVVSGGLLHITSTGDASKGISADGNVCISGGKIVVKTSGAAVYDSSEADYSSCAGIKADGNIAISGGVVQAQSTGTGGKGLNADGSVTISGGTVQVATTGKRAGSGNTTSSPKGIKADGDLVVSGGNIAVKLTGTGDGTEAIESKGAITFNGGCTAAYSYDDAINSAGILTLNNGYVYAHSLNNDAIDSNRNLIINGGNIVAIGAGGAENPIDAAEGYSIYVNGGNVFGVGGSVAQTASSSKQASIAFTASVSGKTLGLFDSSGNGLMAVSVPSTSCTACYMTADGMAAGSTYTSATGVSVSGGTSWCGINVDGSVSGGSTLGTATAAASVGSGMGGGGGGGRRW